MQGAGSLLATFSIVGYDPVTGDLGVAVATKYLAVGARVPHARAGIGAIAAQAYANPVLGPKGLELLAEGLAPTQVIATLMDEDEGRALRQLGVVNARGQAATYTGERCEPWAGGRIGVHCAAQGNMLIGEETVEALIGHFERSRGALADRLVDALRAGEQAGGDKRGRQSSALLVVRTSPEPPLYTDPYLDLRVDSDPQPCRRLRQLLDQHYQLKRETPETEFLALDALRVKEIQLALHRLGRYSGERHGLYDTATRSALWEFCVAENQKFRWRDDARIDPLLLTYLVRCGDGSY